VTRRRILCVHKSRPGQLDRVARALAAAGDAVVALGINTRDLPGV
jgi:hypothetical protein